MRWHDPGWLNTLWAVPLVALLLLLAARWQRRATGRFVSPVMLPRLGPVRDSVRTAVKGLLLICAVASLAIAAARPLFGTYLEDITTSGSDLCIVLDVSRSMLADDVKPSRLERAKSDILDLVNRLQGDRVGLVVFAGSPALKVPLTTDTEFFRSVLNDVDPTAAPVGGSMLSKAILKALESMESRYDRQQVIVLISDGEDHDSFPEEAAKAAADRGVRIVCVGLGDPVDGARIPLRDARGNLSYLQYNGEEVWSRLREDVLQQLAKATQGAYIPARTRVYDLGEIYENYVASTSGAEAELQKRRRFRERFQIFAALAFFCLISESIISAWRRKPRRPSTAGTSS